MGHKKDDTHSETGTQSGSDEEFEYFDAIELQLTDEAWWRVRDYAAQRVRLLAQAGYRVDDDLVEQLVGDAVADTALGVCKWKPDSCGLVTHLRWIIRGRTHKGILRRRSRTETGYLFDQALEEGRGIIEEVESPQVMLERLEVTQRFVAALYDLAHAKEDHVVAGMLDLYREGITDRGEVARELGLTTRQYSRARERLFELIQDMPASLRAEAIAVMRRQDR